MEYEILMKRAYIDNGFRACPAFSTDQPFKDHCTFSTREEAEKHMVKLIHKHRDMAEFKVVRFNKQGR